MNSIDLRYIPEKEGAFECFACRHQADTTLLIEGFSGRILIDLCPKCRGILGNRSHSPLFGEVPLSADQRGPMREKKNMPRQHRTPLSLRGGQGKT